MKLSYVLSLTALLIVPISLSAMFERPADDLLYTEGDLKLKSPRDKSKGSTSKKRHTNSPAENSSSSHVTFSTPPITDPVGQDLNDSSSFNSEETTDSTSGETRGLFSKSSKSSKVSAAAAAIKESVSTSASELTSTLKKLEDASAALLDARKKIESLEKNASYIKPVIIGSACTLTLVIGWLVYQLLYHSHEQAADDDADDHYESAQAQVA